MPSLPIDPLPLLPLAVVGLSSTVALVAALAVGGFAIVALVALLARSDGDPVLQAAAAARQRGAWERMGALARGVAGGSLAIVVILLATVSRAEVRAGAVAGLLGVVVALASEYVALRVAAWAAPRIVDGAAGTGGGEVAWEIAQRAGAIATGLAEGVALLVAAIVALAIDDRAALLALAVGAGATSALVGRAGGAPAAWLLAATALPGSAAALGLVGATRLLDAARSRWRTLPRFAAPLATAAIVPLFLPSELVASQVGWPGAALHVLLLLGVAAAPLVERTLRWLAARDASETPRDRATDAAWLLLWGGALATVAWRIGGSAGAAWLALGFALASRRADEAFAAPLLAESAELARAASRNAETLDRLDRAGPPELRAAPFAAADRAFAPLLWSAAGVLAMGASFDRAPVRPPFALELGALLFGAVAGLLLLGLLQRAERAASTGGGARAMIPALLWSAIVAIELPRVAPALLGSAFAGVVVVGFLSARSAARPLLPAWIVVMVLLALATAPVGR